MTAASLHAHCLGQPTATRPVMRDLSRGELHRFPAALHRPPGHEPARAVPGTSRHRWLPDPRWRIPAAARSDRWGKEGGAPAAGGRPATAAGRTHIDTGHLPASCLSSQAGSRPDSYIVSLYPAEYAAWPSPSPQPIIASWASRAGPW